jgi:hypothetical protein
LSIIDLTKKLINEGLKADKFFLDLSESQLQSCVYHDDQKWTIKDLLAHFISSEKTFLMLFENIVNGGQGTPVDFSINDFNNSQVAGMSGLDSKELLFLFHETRNSTVKWLETLTEEDAKKTGRHPAMGPSSLEEMIKMIYLHNQMHLRDIRKAIVAIKNEE